MKTLIVFDIDGTVADIEHRRKYVRSKPKNWKAFNAGMLNDGIHMPVYNVLQKYLNDQGGTDVIFASGRGEEDRDKTLIWFERADIKGYRKLYMRPKKDSRPDFEIKKEILDQIVEDFGKKPDFAFDDRKQVVDMWIENGVFVFDVAQGKGDF